MSISASRSLGLLLGAASLADCSRTEDVVGTVDTANDAPRGCATDVPVKRRPEGAPVSLADGVYEGGSATSWPLIRNGNYVTLQGQGYVNLRWMIEYTAKAGLITPPIVTVLSGMFVYVGGGGGKNLGDPRPDTGGTWMGNAQEGLSYMAEGVPTPWQNEFYYLDGEVTIAMNETAGLYNVTLSPQTYDQVVTPGWGVYEPGVVCDPE